MCLRRGLPVLLLSAAWLALCVGAAVAVTLPFYDDFENVALGDYPDENGWQTWFSGVTAYVSNAAAQSGTLSFRLVSSPFWSRCDTVFLDEVPDRLTYQASVYVDPMPGRAAWVGLAHGVGVNLPCYNYFTVGSDDGSVGYVTFTGAMGWPPVGLGQFAVGDWVTVQADLDFAAQISDLWVDGVLVATGVPIEPKEFDDPFWGHVVLDRFGAAEYNWAGGGIGVIHLDDVALVGSTPTVITATVDITPSTLNRRSRGRWVTCSIELPQGYAVADIDVESLRLEGVLASASRPAVIGDRDGDGVPDLAVRFDRSALGGLLPSGQSEVEVAGCLADGTPLTGSDTIRVK